VQVRKEPAGDKTFRDISKFQIAAGFGGLALPVA
jgi:hypothetical protein